MSRMEKLPSPGFAAASFFTNGALLASGLSSSLSLMSPAQASVSTTPINNQSLKIECALGFQIAANSPSQKLLWRHEARLECTVTSEK